MRWDKDISLSFADACVLPRRCGSRCVENNQFPSECVPTASRQRNGEGELETDRTPRSTIGTIRFTPCLLKSQDRGAIATSQTFVYLSI